AAVPIALLRHTFRNEAVVDDRQHVIIEGLSHHPQALAVRWNAGEILHRIPIGLKVVQFLERSASLEETFLYIVQMASTPLALPALVRLQLPLIRLVLENAV